ncbi:hypothetical protein TRICI_006422 [Trichomonascus ciferrii]|uniref:Ribosome biogenesis protein ALB1 n=1 Tax=Trichomonascus ciferrii TaxID=44093 RepID=A0A642UHB5_9ASCO|nr:hypothetical protein TRICI_006422 [Trichomonascus ciferrii]
MPSRNAVNNPRKTRPKVHRAASKPIKLNSEGLTTQNAGKVTTKAISKKRAKKDQRNAKYREAYLRSQIDDDDVMKDETDESTLSATQKKLRARKQTIAQANAINLQLEADLPAEEMQLSSSGNGTTLGAPPVYN